MPGARVIRLLPPGGDPMAELAPAWHEAMNAGKETVLIDLKTEPEQGRALCADADVVLESFRPGVVERLGVERAEPLVDKQCLEVGTTRLLSHDVGEPER